MIRDAYTIGLIFPELVDFGAMCWGAFDAAAQHGANAVCFQGNPLQSPIGFSAQGNLLYDLIGADTPLDGLVMWTGWLGQFVGAGEAARFCEHFKPLPIVSISQEIEGIPCVLGDNYQSMRDVINHLVDVHQHRRLALIMGPPNHLESAERYQAYVDLLAEHGIPLDPSLVISAQFTREAGADAIVQLLETRQRMVDAVITGDDFVALGVIEGLQARGLRVPEDVAVVGFDDTPYARASIPPLTTVRQSAYDQGYQGVSLLLARLRGEAIPMRISLPMRLVVRQSCGCANPVVLRAVASLRHAPDGHLFWTELGQARSHVLDSIAQEIAGITDLITRPHIEALCDAFAQEMTGGAAGGFMEALEAVLRAASEASGDLFVYQDVISAMRKTILPLLAGREALVLATNLWGQARVLIGERALRLQAQRHLQHDLRTRSLREIGQEFITTFDLEGLMALLVREIPRLGITGCWLARYAEPVDAPAEAVLLAGFERDHGLSLPPGGQRFPAHQLAIKWVAAHRQPFHVVMEPLYFRDQQLGFVLFEPGPRDGALYEALRGYLTTALYGALLFQRNLDLYRQAVQARAEAEKADQLKTLLLANVSHDLRAPLHVIQGYTQAALTDPSHYGTELPADLARDLGHIRASADYLVRIINDLLDLSRAEIDELDLYPEMVDPHALLRTVFEEMAGSLDGEDQVAWRLDVPARLPLLQVDPDRLRQILFNLLSNAAKFTDAGEIVLGAEVHPPYLHVWVRDTGIGIPPDHQERVFEPFMTGDRNPARQQGIGLGLSITRRLVLLHKGVMSLESAPGQGSTFHVYLPLPSLRGDVTALAGTGEAAMLLLASHDSVPPAAAELASRQGWDVARVSSMGEFHTLLAGDRRRFVSIAWDLDAASPADWGLAQQVLGHPQLCRLPLLLFGREAGYAAHDDAGRATRVTQVMLKPFGGDALLDAIARLLPQELVGSALLVDDDVQALDLYQRLVHSALPELRTVLADSGAAALSHLEAGLVPDLVILDLMMPPPDGFDVLKSLRAGPATRHVPVLVLSGKMLGADDIRRLSQHDVLLHSKGILGDNELQAVLRGLVSDGLALDRPTSELVKLALAHIHQHYARPISREEICSVLGISENYLSRLFRQELGLTLVDYINRYRVNIARHLLRETNETITHVAQQVGFDDSAYFSRVFTRYVGRSPRAYRREVEGSPGSPTK